MTPPLTREQAAIIKERLKLLAQITDDEFDALQAIASGEHVVVPAPSAEQEREAWLPRFGLEWRGPKEPVTVPMEDGYWTPWHLASEIIAKLQTALPNAPTKETASAATAKPEAQMKDGWNLAELAFVIRADDDGEFAHLVGSDGVRQIAECLERCAAAGGDDARLASHIPSEKMKP